MFVYILAGSRFVIRKFSVFILTLRMFSGVFLTKLAGVYIKIENPNKMLICGLDRIFGDWCLRYIRNNTRQSVFSRKRIDTSFVEGEISETFKDGDGKRKKFSPLM